MINIKNKFYFFKRKDKILEIQKEVLNMKKFKNKYIIKCYGSFQDDNYNYIIMEYAQKGDLN